MRRTIGIITILSVVLMLASCDSDEGGNSGFKKMENGAYMKFYTKGDSEVMPRLKDEATIEMAQYFNDSMLFTTAGMEPMTIVLTEADFVGDVVDGLLMMHVGDSARLMVPADSVFTIMMHMEEIPEEYAGKPIYYDLKLLSVKPYEKLEAERAALMDSLKAVEDAFLTHMRDDSSNTQTESGIIIIEKTGKGKMARMGDYIDFDFMICNAEGDTIMYSFGDEPVEVQYGEEFICEGITEALGMVPEGGTMRFVLPSSLAFDSTGYKRIILPYTPLVVKIAMNSIMDKATFDKHQKALEAQMEAEQKRLMALEEKTMAAYIKAKGITEMPTETGLYIIRKEEGQGEVAKWGDNVAVHYVMWNLKDEQLESSYDYGQPMLFTIGKGEMVPAIEEAVMTMAPGAKVTIITPSCLAFGEFDLGESLPPYSPLKVDLELVEIK